MGQIQSNKKVVKVLGKRTGLGNQIQFIPIIRELQKYYTVCSDSKVFSSLGLDIEEEQKADIHITVFGYDHQKLWKERLANKGTFYGFKYRIKKRHIGIGYDKSIRFDEGISEIDNNVRLFEYCFNKKIENFRFHLDGWKPEKNLVIAGISPKEEKTLPFTVWRIVLRKLMDKGFDVLTVDKDIGVNYVKTPDLAKLKETLSRASYYIGTDSGVMHLADILGVPSLIMFGSTSIIKNQPYNRGKVITRNLSCSPCFDWGRINCQINYECMKFNHMDIVNSFLSFVKDIERDE